MIGQVKAKIRDAVPYMGYDIIIYRQLPQGIEMNNGDGTYSTVAEGAAYDGPTLRVGQDELQALSNALAEMGINPAKEYTRIVTGKQ